MTPAHQPRRIETSMRLAVTGITRIPQSCGRPRDTGDQKGRVDAESILHHPHAL
jgi:hypothetical protein